MVEFSVLLKFGALLADRTLEAERSGDVGLGPETDRLPAMESYADALWAIGDELPNPGEALEQLADFQQATSGAKIIVFLARRAFCLFMAAREAGLLPKSLEDADRENRVVSSRALDDYGASWLDGRDVVLIDDTVVSGKTMERAVAQARTGTSGTIEIHSAISQLTAKKLAKRLNALDIDPRNIWFRRVVDAGAEGDLEIAKHAAVINATMQQSARFYFVDFPIFRPVKLSRNQYRQLSHLRDWRVEEISSKAHARKGIVSLTILPRSPDVAGSIARSICPSLSAPDTGRPVGLALTKVRVLLREETDGFVATFMPKVVTEPTTVAWARRAQQAMDPTAEQPTTACGVYRRMQFLLSLRLWASFKAGLPVSLQSVSFALDTDEASFHLPERRRLPRSLPKQDRLPDFVPFRPPISHVDGYLTELGRQVEPSYVAEDVDLLYGGVSYPATTALLRHVLTKWGRPELRTKGADYDYRSQVSGLALGDLKQALGVRQATDWDAALALDTSIDRLRDAGVLVATTSRFLAEDPGVDVTDIRRVHDSADEGDVGIMRCVHAAEATRLASIPQKLYLSAADEFQRHGKEPVSDSALDVVDDLLSLATNIFDPSFLSLRGERYAAATTPANDAQPTDAVTHKLEDAATHELEDELPDLGPLARSAAVASMTTRTPYELVRLVRGEGIDSPRTVQEYRALLENFAHDYERRGGTVNLSSEFTALRSWLRGANARPASLPPTLVRNVRPARVAYTRDLLSGYRTERLPTSITEERFVRFESACERLNLSAADGLSRLFVLRTASGTDVVAESTIFLSGAMEAFLEALDRKRNSDWAILAWLLSPTAAHRLGSLRQDETLSPHLLREMRRSGLSSRAMELTDT